MPIASPTELKAHLSKLLPELDKRAKRSKLLDGIVEGSCPLPDAIVKANVTKAYRLLMPMAEAPWGSLVVDSVQDRLEVSGIKTGTKSADSMLWRDVWQANAMDAESLLLHDSALVSGRGFALVWPRNGEPEITLDSAEQMIVQYREGNRRDRVAALRRWVDDDEQTNVTLYRPEAIYKFRQSKEQKRAPGRIKAADTWWEARDVAGEAWPLENPFNVVPVVEFAVNRRLKPGSFGYARGEFEHCLGLIDRINLLTFLGLVVAFWMGFPLRGIIGDKILRDDNGEALPPFKVGADQIFQLENSNAEIAEFKAADRKNLSVFAELDQLATITKTPRHYFPMDSGMNNLSADAIRASEGGLNSKVVKHKGSLGEGHEEILRLGGMMLDQPVRVPSSAAISWMDHESRSLAERADAAVKLASIEGMPWQIVAEKALNLTQEEITRAETGGASDVIGQLLRAAAGGGSGDPESASA